MKAGLLKGYTTFLMRFRVLIIIGLSFITFLLFLQIPKIQRDMNPDLWAPQSHPNFKATKIIEEVFGGRTVAVIGIIPKEGDIFRPDFLAKVRHIQDGIEQIPEAIRYNVVSLAARKVKDIKGTADGMEVRQMMETIPQNKQEMDRLRAAVFANQIYINSLVSPDGKAAAVIADFKIDKDNPSYLKLYRAIQKVVEKEQDDTVNIYLGGIPIYIGWIEFYAMKMPIYFGIALLIIIIIQYWSFRSFQGMILPIITAILSVIWALGLMGLFGIHMDSMSMNTPILIMAVAAGHAIQILKRYYEEYHLLIEQNQNLSPMEASRRAVSESLIKVGPVMITACLIAAITFYSLMTAEISVIRHFGFLAGSGILSALVLEMTFIPSVRSLLPAPKYSESQRERKSGLLDRLLILIAENIAGGRAKWILVFMLALIMLAFVGVSKIYIDNSYKRYHKQTSKVNRDDAILNSTFGGTNPLLFLIEGDKIDSFKDPNVLSGVATLQDFVNHQPKVGKSQSIVDLIKKMNQAMHHDDPSYNEVPENRDLISQYFLLYGMSGDPQDLDYLVDNDYKKVVLWVYTKDDSTTYADDLCKKTLEIAKKVLPPGVTVRMGGGLANTIAINEVVTRSKVINVAQMAVVVFVLSSIALGSVVGGLLVVTPLLLIVLANFGLLGWLGIPLDFGTASTASMAIGVGADYELYLLYRFREELTNTRDVVAATRNSMLTSGKAILFVALSVAGGYSVLLTVPFGLYIRLASMVIATMLFSALSAILFLRSLMIIFKPRFIFGDERHIYLTQPTLAVKEDLK